MHFDRDASGRLLRQTHNVGRLQHHPVARSDASLHPQLIAFRLDLLGLVVQVCAGIAVAQQLVAGSQVIFEGVQPIRVAAIQVLRWREDAKGLRI